MMDRKGFSLVELLIVVSILGILASVAVPKVQAARARARAASIIGAVRAIRIGATIYLDSAGDWPATAAQGVIPSGLGGYIPPTAGFTGNGYRLRWRRTSVTSGGVSTSRGSVVIIMTDDLLCEPVAVLMGGPSPNVAVNCAAANGRVTLTIDR
jgi:prepilin-type N-terminal cleavage/methylation domain-containing protein